MDRPGSRHGRLPAFWDGLMQNDVTDGVHATIEQGIADPHQICIVGAFFGGPNDSNLAAASQFWRRRSLAVAHRDARA